MGDAVRIQTARLLGEQATRSTLRGVHHRLQSQLRSSVGVRKNPLSPCDDPMLSYFAPDSIVRAVHADLPSMLIGGLASLLFQMLHPLAMTGVAQHSRYREDPLGRLERTAHFLGITTFGSRDEAHRAIQLVRTIHASVEGVAPDGRSYAANDPALLTWVHAVEVQSFLSSTMAYGPRALSRAQQDRYLAEMARVALDLGAARVPRSVDELNEYFEGVRPELKFTPEARSARNFVMLGVRRWPHEVVTYGTLVAAAQGVLPPWARRQLGLVSLPASNRLVVRPLAMGLCTTLRWITSPTG